MSPVPIILSALLSNLELSLMNGKTKIRKNRTCLLNIDRRTKRRGKI